MQGYLKKRVKELKLFQTKIFPTRYYVLNFADAIMIISEKKGHIDDSNSKVIPFRNILETFLPMEEYEKKAKEVCSRKFNFPFFVKTEDRLFELYASTDEERTLWMAAFVYLIKSTFEVQKIINRNNEQYKQDLELQTKKM